MICSSTNNNNNNKTFFLYFNESAQRWMDGKERRNIKIIFQFSFSLFFIYFFSSLCACYKHIYVHVCVCVGLRGENETAAQLLRFKRNIKKKFWGEISPRHCLKFFFPSLRCLSLSHSLISSPLGSHHPRFRARIFFSTRRFFFLFLFLF